MVQKNVRWQWVCWRSWKDWHNFYICKWWEEW